jgi:hypothetical protein
MMVARERTLQATNPNIFRRLRAFTDPNLVSSGLTDLFAEVFGPKAGIGCRATIGVTSLANNHCFETWMDLEVR